MKDFNSIDEYIHLKGRFIYLYEFILAKWYLEFKRDMPYHKFYKSHVDKWMRKAKRNVCWRNQYETLLSRYETGGYKI